MPKLCLNTLLTLFAIGGLAACQLNQTPPDNTALITPPIQAKGEWSLVSISSPNTFDTDQMRYRISLRIQSQEFSVAAPCARLLGQYRATADQLTFRRIATRDLVCADDSDTPLLKQTLQQTHFYRLQDEHMQWLDQQHRVVAVWQRIYL